MKDRIPSKKDKKLSASRFAKRTKKHGSRKTDTSAAGADCRPGLLHYSAILDNIPDIAWLKDADSRFIAVNDPFGAACGRSPGDIVGKSDHDIWPKDLAESYRADDAEVLRTGKRKRVEERIVGPDGRESWIETIKTPLVDDRGQVIGTIGIARDITERRQAEAKLRHVTRLYAFLSQINQAIVRTQDRDVLFRTICAVAIDHGQFVLAWIGLIDEASGTVVPAVHAGRDEGYLRSLSIHIGDAVTGGGPTGASYREGSLVICDDIAKDPRMLPWRKEAMERGYRSSAAIPLRLKGRVTGSLNLYAPEPGFFSAEERRLLTEIGIDISFALDTIETRRERQMALEAVQKSEERHRHLLETLVHGVQENDCSGMITYSNPAHHRILGHENGELLGKMIWHWQPTEEAQHALRRYLDVLVREQPPPTPYLSTARRKDGAIVELQIDWDYERDDTGRLQGFISVITDITGRRRTEEALKESEHRHRTLFETMAQGVVYQAADGRIISANSAAERILGLTADQMRGRTSRDPRWRTIQENGEDFPGDQHPAMVALRTGRPVHSVIMGVLHPVRNEYRWILVEAVPEFRSGETVPFQVYTTFTDITDRKRTEEELSHRSASLSTLLDVSKSLAATLDLETVLQRTTDGVSELFGLNTSAVYLLEGEKLRLGATTPPLPPDFPEALRYASLADHPNIAKAVATGELVVVPDMLATDLTPAERSVTETRDLRTVIFIPLVAGEKAIGTLIVGSMTTPRAVDQVEIDLCRTLANIVSLTVENARLYLSGRHYAVELEQQILDRKRAEQEHLELERRLLHAQKLESLGILAGGIAHDFNNLLMAILGNLDLALRKLPQESSARANIEQSMQAARRATDLTRQMLAYSGKGMFVVKALDLNTLVEEHAHLFRSSVARTTALDLRLGSSLPTFDADAGQIQQVIMNLLTNASESLDEKPGTIIITTGAQACDDQCLRNSRVETTPPAGRFVFLEVSDTGCGMDEETQQHLFVPFFSTKAKGRGLGMSAILGIVRGHGGALFVQSQPGRGTTIRILFPVTREERPVAHEAPAATASRSRSPSLRGTVLLAEDEDIVREVCAEMLMSSGMEVLTAVDGQDAVDVFRKNADRISHVILDLSMPRMDGVTALGEMRRIRPGVKIILCSGYDKQDSIRRLSGTEVAGFIQKPYTLENLLEALEQAGGELTGRENDHADAVPDHEA